MLSNRQSNRFKGVKYINAVSTVSFLHTTALPEKSFRHLDKPVDTGSADALVRTSVRSTLSSRRNRSRLFALRAQLRARAPALPGFARPLSRELSS